MIPNYFEKDDWFHIVRETLICCGYKKNLKLSEEHWGRLFEQNLHPIEAIEVSEGFRPIGCYSEVHKEWFERQIFVQEALKKKKLFTIKKDQWKYLNPKWFVKMSLTYMKGYPKYKVLLSMPFSYLRFCYFMIFKS